MKDTGQEQDWASFLGERSFFHGKEQNWTNKQ